MADEIAIKVEHVSKSFRLPHDKQNSIKGGLISLIRNGKRSFETQEVLKDVSFEIKKGEFFGIVGRNGSGKSTLLKMLAGTYMPTNGQVQVNGSLTPFIELGVGFNPELSGRENVFLNGALLGFNRAEVVAMYDEIIEFAELERFMDQKLKNYSSGMQVRLAFSIAIQAKSDILVLDEVLAVGDEAFQRKCFNYFATLKEEKRTVVLVTHDMESVKRFCDRAVLIDKGKLAFDTTPADVAKEYSRMNAVSTVMSSDAQSSAEYPVAVRVHIKESNGGDNVYLQGEPIIFEARLKAQSLDKPITNAEFGLSFHDKDGKTVYIGSTTRNKISGIDFSKNTESHIIKITVQNVFPEGTYVVNFALLDLIKREVFGRLDGQVGLNVFSNEKAPWLLYAPTDIEIR